MLGWSVAAADDLFDREWRRCEGCAHVGIERLLPHGNEIDEVALLACVLLCDLQLDRLVGVRECGEEWAYRFAHLKVDRSVLDLHDDVVVELAVERVEVVVACAGPVGLHVVPVEMMVVDEATVEDHATMWMQSAGHDVRGIGWGAAILRWTGAAFGVSLDDDAAKVRNRAVDFIHLGLPPGSDLRIQRIECLQAAEYLWAAHIDGH